MATLLSVNSYFYRRDGSEAVFLDQNRLLGERGWHVVPFAMHHPKNPPTPWADYFVTEVEFGNDYSLGEKLARVPKVIYSLEARRQITRLLKRIEPDLAHCHSIYHHISPSILRVLKRFGVPTVMTLHDLKLACPAYHMFNRDGICEQCKNGRTYNVLKNRCIKDSASLSGIIMVESLLNSALRSYRNNVDRFLSPCQFYIDKLVQWGWPRDKFIHLPNFVDTRAFTPRSRVGKSFFYFGRLSPEKGLLTLLEAASRSGVPLRLAGSGPQLSALRARADSLGVDAEFLGHLSGRSLVEEIYNSRATLLPSEWYENAPISVLESYALGKPAIGARIGGIPELIEHGVTGWTFESRSVDALAEVLRHVAALPDRTVVDMGRAARERVEKQFSEQAYIIRLTDVYKQLGIAA